MANVEVDSDSLPRRHMTPLMRDYGLQAATEGCRPQRERVLVSIDTDWDAARDHPPRAITRSFGTQDVPSKAEM